MSLYPPETFRPRPVARPILVVVVFGPGVVTPHAPGTTTERAFVSMAKAERWARYAATVGASRVQIQLLEGEGGSRRRVVFEAFAPGVPRTSDRGTAGLPLFPDSLT